MSTLVPMPRAPRSNASSTASSRHSPLCTVAGAHVSRWNYSVGRWDAVQRDITRSQEIAGWWGHCNHDSRVGVAAFRTPPLAHQLALRARDYGPLNSAGGTWN
jgi:hypothetical protein